MQKLHRCDGPNCDRTWKQLPKRGFTLSGKGKRYCFCSLGCLEQALLAGLGKRWYAPAGQRRFVDRYWEGKAKRWAVSWPHQHEAALLALAGLRDAIKPGRLDNILAAVAQEIRKQAERAAKRTTDLPWSDWDKWYPAWLKKQGRVA